MKTKGAILSMSVLAACCAFGDVSEAEDEEVAFQHAFIRNHGLAPKVEEKFSRNRHPDAQWYPKAGLGLFIHWGLSSVTGWGYRYHFLYDWLQTGDIVCDRFPKPKSVTVGGTPIPYEWKDGTLKISIPYLKIGNLTTVVDVE